MRIILYLALLFLVPGRMPGMGWTWQYFHDEGDIRMVASYNDASLFDFRLGGGGDIAGMRYCPDNYRDLLASPYGGNETDRVIQWTLWSDNYSVQTSTGSWSFNEDLAGSSDGTFSPTISVREHGNVLDVYATPQDQWFRDLNSSMQARYSCLSRYEMLDDGVLKVRRVILTSNVLNRMDDGHRYDIYFEQWIPLKVGPNEFDACALSLDTAGLPNWWYRANYNIPYYPFLPVQSSFGYAVVYKEAAFSTMPVIGIVFGTKELQVASSQPVATTGRHVINSMGWGDDTPWDMGLAVLPALEMHNVASNSVIDYTYYIVPRAYADASLKAKLESLAASVPPPVVYSPDYPLSGDLQIIVNTLKTNLGRAGMRTDHLAPFLNRTAIRPLPAY